MAKPRLKPSGKWEIGLRHPSLPNGRKYFTFDTEAKLRFRSRQAPLFGEELEPRKFLLARQEASYANPTRYDHTKLFPRSNWEFTKWNKQDAVGFIVCVALVGFILVFFKTVLVIGS